MSHQSCRLAKVDEDRFRGELEIRNASGLHLRPAAEIAQIAVRAACTVTVFSEESEADGDSILQLIGLKAEQGCRLVVETEGEDALPTLLAVTETLAAGDPKTQNATESGNGHKQAVLSLQVQEGAADVVAACHEA